jgi:hypothetical protein
VCETLYNFKIRYAAAAAEDWTPDLVDEYLFDYFPRKVSADADLVGRVPEILTEFFGWMGETGRMKPAATAKTRRLLAGRKKDFFREALDPGNFGSAKTITTAMKKAGVDLGNQKEVDDFLAKWNTRLPVPGEKESLDFADAPEEEQGVEEVAPRVSHKKWAWSGEGSPPDPKAPCPCGSGRRYKKCCKPR